MERLREEVKRARRRSLESSPSSAQHLAREAVVSSWPKLPALIAARIGVEDARIFSAGELRKLLSEFAVDVLLAQQDIVEDWIKRRAEKRRKKRT